jgi:hypothetical protein
LRESAPHRAAARLEPVTYRNGDRHACEAKISYQTTSFLPDGLESPWALWRPEGQRLTRRLGERVEPC